LTLTKIHIVEAIAEQNGYTKKNSTDIIETLLEIIKRTLESGEDVLVSGFGKFCVKEKKQRRGRNPSKCSSRFEVDDRLECVFANPDNIRLPVNGMICPSSGLVQGDDTEACLNCGLRINTAEH
jgi:integration host factor subunit alpha